VEAVNPVRTTPVGFTGHSFAIHRMANSQTPGISKHPNTRHLEGAWCFSSGAFNFRVLAALWSCGSICAARNGQGNETARTGTQAPACGRDFRSESEIPYIQNEK